jgi:hypothetical protein
MTARTEIPESMLAVPLITQLALRSGPVLSRDPLTDVGCAIHQHNVSRLALSEKIDAVLTYQSHILKVKGDAPQPPFRGD